MKGASEVSSADTKSGGTGMNRRSDLLRVVPLLFNSGTGRANQHQKKAFSVREFQDGLGTLSSRLRLGSC